MVAINCYKGFKPLTKNGHVCANEDKEMAFD
jgi:hypothetical protein